MFFAPAAACRKVRHSSGNHGDWMTTTSSTVSCQRFRRSRNVSDHVPRGCPHCDTSLGRGLGGAGRGRLGEALHGGGDRRRGRRRGGLGEGRQEGGGGGRVGRLAVGRVVDVRLRAGQFSCEDAV